MYLRFSPGCLFFGGMEQKTYLKGTRLTRMLVWRPLRHTNCVQTGTPVFICFWQHSLQRVKQIITDAFLYTRSNTITDILVALRMMILFIAVLEINNILPILLNLCKYLSERLSDLNDFFLSPPPLFFEGGGGMLKPTTEHK